MDRQLLVSNRKFSPEIRAFALTLHFYSGSAYNYVRQQFNNLLPHPATIRKWYTVVDGTPGFTAQSFKAIQERNNEQPVFGNLTVDEMHIKEKIDFFFGKYYGHIEMGSQVQGDGDVNIIAKHALVFMAVSLNAHWKVRLGYFLIDGLSGKERADLLKTCLHLLYDT